MNLEALLVSAGSQFLAQAMANPEALMGFLNAAGCHTAPDVAQDALDAYKAGHLTRDQALRIIAVALEQPTAKPRTTPQQDIDELLRVAKATYQSPPALEEIRRSVGW